MIKSGIGFLRWPAVAACIALSQAVSAAGDPARGAKVFQACAACHSVKPDDHMTGPSLAHIWERKAGTAADFLRYSDAIKAANIVWTQGALDKWLADPNALIPGTSMTFQGLREAGDREDVIAYLKAVSEGKPPAQGGGGRGMSMSMRKADLKKAPPEGRVTSMNHCRDTYTVRTADGKAAKVWEFNLRLKTDSSKEGPNPGEPVIVGAGMQGDRASVVFASSGEISSFIKQDCR
jgi:cytochrome c